MNSITIAGQLGRDAEVRFLPNGDPVAGFSVADSQGKDKPTIWFNCSLFGKRAESLAQYLTKGQSVTLVGTLTEREYTNKEGAKVKAQDVRVSDIALQGGQKQQAPAAKKVEGYQGGTGKRDSSFDDDIPF